MTDRAEEDRVEGLEFFDGALGQGFARFQVSIAAEVEVASGELKALELGDSLEDLEAFGDDFIGATGSQAELADIGERYGVVWRKVETPESAVEYLVDHSASLYLVDASGEIIERVLHAPTPGPLLAALDRALN